MKAADGVRLVVLPDEVFSPQTRDFNPRSRAGTHIGGYERRTILAACSAHRTG